MFVVLGSRTEATQRLPRGMTANRVGLSSYDGDHDGSVTLGILAEDWQRHHQPARTPRDRPRRLEALRPMGLAGRRRSDRCSSRLSPAESRSRRRLTPQRLRSRPRLAQSPPRWRTHRRPSHQSVHGLGLPKNEAATREAARGPPPATCRPAPPGSVRSSSQSIRSRRRCGLRVRRNLVDDRGSPLDDSAHRGGSRSCARPSRRRHAGELRTHRCSGSRDGSPDVRSLRRDGRARRSSCSV